MSEKIAIKFNISWSRYNAGETASFEPDVANRLLEATFVNSEGKKTLAAVRAGSFLERAGVTKSTPKEGEDKPKPKQAAPAPARGRFRRSSSDK